MTYDMNMLGDISEDMPDLTLDGTLITGTVKAAQRFMVLLLTNIQEDPFGRGTRIPRLLGESNLDVGALEGVYRIAATDVLEQMTATYTDATPPARS